MLAIALVLDGHSRTDAAEACGMDRQTLRDWVHRDNAEGIGGLANHPAPGPVPRLSAEQEDELARWVEDGPELARDGVVRWRCRDLQERGRTRLRHPLPRAHDRQAAGEASLSAPVGAAAAPAERPRGAGGVPGGFAELVKAVAAELGQGTPIEVWFGDEARVGQQGTVTRVWAKRGSRPRVPRDRRYTWAYLFGAVCPERRVGAAVVLPQVTIGAMEAHLAEISRCVSPSAHAVLVLDRAGWHASPRLRVPDNISLIPLPPYAPELNSMENVWRYMRDNWLSHRVWDSYDAIVEACCGAWNTLMRVPEQIASITKRSWAQGKI